MDEKKMNDDGITYQQWLDGMAIMGAGPFMVTMSLGLDACTNMSLDELADAVAIATKKATDALMERREKERRRWMTKQSP